MGSTVGQTQTFVNALSLFISVSRPLIGHFAAPFPENLQAALRGRTPAKKVNSCLYDRSPVFTAREITGPQVSSDCPKKSFKSREVRVQLTSFIFLLPALREQVLEGPDEKK